jgi:hypothetical protein
LTPQRRTIPDRASPHFRIGHSVVERPFSTSHRLPCAREESFHNGAAANVKELIEFYNQRCHMNLTPNEKRQVIAFLNSLQEV